MTHEVQNTKSNSGMSRGSWDRGDKFRYDVLLTNDKLSYTRPAFQLTRYNTHNARVRFSRRKVDKRVIADVLFIYYSPLIHYTNTSMELFGSPATINYWSAERDINVRLSILSIRLLIYFRLRVSRKNVY